MTFFFLLHFACLLADGAEACSERYTQNMFGLLCVWFVYVCVCCKGNEKENNELLFFINYLNNYAIGWNNKKKTHPQTAHTTEI